jgi:DNA-binding transcriptional LysR family regulator
LLAGKLELELRHARYFVAVAEELNFRRAAERLRLAQPSLSTQIRLLEEDVGAKLLERDSHKVELTPAGRSFLEGCRRLLQDADDYARTARRIDRGESGPLSIRVFFSDLTREPLQYLIHSLFSFHL